MRVVLTLILLSIQVTVLAQYRKPDIDLDQFIQQRFQGQDEDLPYEEIYEVLFQYYRNPLDLNEATYEELASLFILTPLQINRIIQHRQQTGAFQSLYELQVIEDFDLTVIHSLLPFVTAGNPDMNARSLVRQLKDAGFNYLIVRTERTLESKKGYQTDSAGQKPYDGSPLKHYIRYRCSEPNKFSLGFTMEKDAGEVLNFNKEDKRYGFDFLSAHLMAKKLGIFKQINLGDYQVSFGQGLVFGGGFGMGKGSEPITTVRKSSVGIRPYSSSMESGFYRGLGSTINIWNFEITTLLSSQKPDARIMEDSVSGKQFISSLIQTGFHRNNKEILTKNSITETLVGGNAHYSSKIKNVQAGVNFLSSTYTYELQKEITPHNQFDFSGKSNFNYGAYYTFLVQNFNFFGEYARSKSNGNAFVTGFISSISSRVSLSLLIRNYEKDFHSIKGSSFGENSRNINEKGIYTGLKITPLKNWTMDLYFDSFKFPWLNSQTDAPSKGNEYLGKLTFQPGKTFSLFLQYRNEIKEKNLIEDGNKTNRIENAKKQAIVFNADFTGSRKINFQSRVQVSQYNFQSQTTGFLISQMINMNFQKLSFSTYFALFEAEDFNTRQYAYERDVLYGFSIPGLSGSGFRSYFLIKLPITKKLNGWVKISQTTYNHVSQISSGTETIEGNKKTDIRLQLKYDL